MKKKVKWYIKVWSPYGKAIGHHYVCFVKINGENRQVSRYHERNGSGKLRFYAVVRHNIDHEQKDPYVFRTTDWQEVLTFLRKDT